MSINVPYITSRSSLRSCQHSAVSLYEKSPNARTTCGSIARMCSIVSWASLVHPKSPTVAKLKFVLFSDAPFGLPKGGFIDCNENMIDMENVDINTIIISTCVFRICLFSLSLILIGSSCIDRLDSTATVRNLLNYKWPSQIIYIGKDMPLVKFECDSAML